MQNWSQVFADTLALYESPYCPGDQGDAGKGQVLVRAGYTIHTTLDGNVGYISKNPGQTQFFGVAVDALTDRVDGSGADFLTDEPQADGRRLIKVAFTPYAVPPPGSPPPTNWVQPTASFLDYPGPLVLRSTTPPTPTPPPSAVTLDDVMALLHQMQAEQNGYTVQILAHTTSETDRVIQRLNELRQEVIDFAEGAGKVLLLRYLRERPEEP